MRIKTVYLNDLSFVIIYLCTYQFFFVFCKFQAVVRKVEANRTDGRDKPMSEVKIATASCAEVAEPFNTPKEASPEN